MKRFKPAKVIIYRGTKRIPWKAKMFDENGSIRSMITGYSTSHAHHNFPEGHNDREYVERMVAEYWPELPVEYKDAGS